MALKRTSRRGRSRPSRRSGSVQQHFVRPKKEAVHLMTDWRYIACSDKEQRGVIHGSRSPSDVTCVRCIAAKPYDFKRGEFEDRVRNPGKFEGQEPWVPYFYEKVLDGQGADRKGGTSLAVTPKDRALFPELAGRRTVLIKERDDGFVYAGKP